MKRKKKEIMKTIFTGSTPLSSESVLVLVNRRIGVDCWRRDDGRKCPKTIELLLLLLIVDNLSSNLRRRRVFFWSLLNSLLKKRILFEAKTQTLLRLNIFILSRSKIFLRILQQFLGEFSSKIFQNFLGKIVNALMCEMKPRILESD